MNNTFKKILKIITVLVILAVAVFFSARYYAYNGGKRDLQSEEAAFTLKSIDFVSEFTTKETEANKKYLEKPVIISGTISSVNGKEVILDGVVVCGFTVADASLKEGQSVLIKGRVVGYDDLMGSVNMDQCSINK